ncbi:MAG: hypothetical protein RL557_209 [archaeon]|jgi:TM2 domain-containing membrane protein YozV
MAKKRKAKRNTNSKNNKKNIAILALLLNLIVFPGIGSIVGGKTKEGVIQLILAAVGLALIIILIGIPIFLAVWIWGIITGINLIKRAK